MMDPSDKELFDLCMKAQHHMDNPVVREAVVRLATTVKLVHNPEDSPQDSVVLMDLVRRYTSTMIAQQIIGIQPLISQHYPLTAASSSVDPLHGDPYEIKGFDK